MFGSSSVNVGFGSGSWTFLLSDSVRFLAKPELWFGSFLLGLSSFPSSGKGKSAHVIKRKIWNVSNGRALQDTDTVPSVWSSLPSDTFAPSAPGFLKTESVSFGHVTSSSSQTDVYNFVSFCSE